MNEISSGIENLAIKISISYGMLYKISVETAMGYIVGTYKLVKYIRCILFNAHNQS